MTSATGVATSAETTSVAPRMPRECARCGEGFLDADHLALHVARRHEGPLTADERASFEAALAREEAWLSNFRKHMKGGLAALVPLTVVALVMLLVYVSGAPVSMALLMIPPALGFAGLAYVFSAQDDG